LDIEFAQGAEPIRRIYPDTSNLQSRINTRGDHANGVDIVLYLLDGWLHSLGSGR
jgi:hypothetical protein